MAKRSKIQPEGGEIRRTRLEAVRVHVEDSIGERVVRQAERDQQVINGVALAGAAS
jgi:hypothetical protein